MKCKVCGYELKPGRTYCPMCGTKVETFDFGVKRQESEMTWNTKDFPKPKKARDIDMDWGNISSSNGKGLTDADIEAAVAFKKPIAMMSNDGSEGFVSIPEKKEEKTVEPPRYLGFEKKETKPVEAPHFEGFEKVARPQGPFVGFNTNPSANIPPEHPFGEPAPMPPKPEGGNPPYWYTQNFTASGVMKTGPAFPIPQGKPQGAGVPNDMPPCSDMQPFEDINPAAQAALSAAMPDATIQYVRFDKPQVQPASQTPAYTSAPQQAPAFASAPQQNAAYKPTPAYPDSFVNKDYTIQAAQEKRPERFYTFQRKSDEFQALIEQEYAKIRANRQKDFDPIPKDATSNAFVAEKTVRAQDIESFEDILFADRKHQRPQQASPVSAKVSEQQGSAIPEKKEAPIEAPVIKQAKAAPAPQIQEKPVEAPKPMRQEAPAPKVVEKVENESFTLDDLISAPVEKISVVSDPTDPNFDIKLVEKTIQELTAEINQEEVIREERKAKLKAMEDARNAYFAALDESFAEKEKGRKMPKADATPIFLSIKNAEKEEAAQKVEVEKETAQKVETEKAESQKSDADAVEMAADVKAEENKEQPESKAEVKTVVETEVETKEPTLVDFPSDELLDEFEGLYDRKQRREEYYEEDEKPRHLFLKFLLVLIVIVALCEGLIIAMQYFIPDSQITAQATEIESAAINWISDLLDKLIVFIDDLINK